MWTAESWSTVGSWTPQTGATRRRACRRRGPALRRIAFLLERRLAEPFKVKAFRRAAATLLALRPVSSTAGSQTGRSGSSRGSARPPRPSSWSRVRRRDAGRTSPTSSRPPGRWRTGGRRPPRPAAGRPALALRLVRRRFADRGDGDDRRRARPRVPRPHRPLAPAQGRQRAERGPAAPPARGRRWRQRPPRRARSGCCPGIEVDILDDGVPGPDRRDAPAARRRGGLGALQAADGARRR